MKTKYKYIVFRRHQEGWQGARRRFDRAGRGWNWRYISIEFHDYTKRWLCWSFGGLSAQENRDIAYFLDQLNKGGKPK